MRRLDHHLGTASNRVDQTAESISPLMIDITRGGAFSIGRLVPSGRVAFPAVPMLRNGEHVRLISLLTPSDGDLLRQMFIRDVDRLDETVTMPAGHAIALIVRANGQATVVSQPFTVRGGAETTVTLSPPTRFERTLVLRLLRPRVIEEDDHDRLTVSLIDTQQRRPNDLVSAADSFLAIWYGLDDAPARLEADSNLLYFDDRASDIRPSDGSYVERQLRTRPTLTINMSPLPARRAENVLISQSQTLDIRIPANSLALRVFDAVDRKAVLGAEITLLNHWSDAAGSHSQVSTVFSNSDATALPPQRCGTTEIRVRAAGYSDAAPLTVAIDDATQQRSIDVPLQALHDFTELRVRLEDGTPGSGAELAQWSDEQMIWRGVADDEGMIKVPNAVAGQTLLLRHPAAASAIVLFSANEAVTITMHSAAPPLIAKLVRHDGTPIGSAAARITFWIGGVRVSGPAAGFMTFSLGASTSDGRWIARGLSPAPLRILATRRTSPAQIRAGALDAIATSIAYPWTSAVSLTLADE